MWLIRDFGSQGPFTTAKSGVPYKKRDQQTPVKFGALPGVHVPMCAQCNGKLSRTVEEPAKPIIRALIPWTEHHIPPTISPDEAEPLARWFLKVGLLSAHPLAVHDNPHLDRETDVPRLEPFAPEWIEWLREGDPPPKGFSVYVGKRSLKEEAPYEGEVRRIFVPRVVVDGRDLHYMTRSFGVRGLDATIVWHPGWEILNPQVEAGRVMQLWPNPSTVNFASLANVDPRELRFVPGIGLLRLSLDAFLRAARSPLGVDVDPTLRYFGNLQ
jgi:hypothetical protein